MNFKNLILVSAVLFSGAVLSADECKKDCPPPKKEMRQRPDKRHGKKNNFRIYGQVMNSMTAEERKEMDELFRTDKEEFKKRMDAKVAKLRQEMKAKFMKIRELKKAYAKADDAKKAEIKAELRKLVADGYAKRLEKTRKHVEMMRKRADEVEKKLKESEVNADKNIDAGVEKILSRPERKPEHRRPMPPRDGKKGKRPMPPRDCKECGPEGRKPMPPCPAKNNPCGKPAPCNAK